VLLVPARFGKRRCNDHRVSGPLLSHPVFPGVYSSFPASVTPCPPTLSCVEKYFLRKESGGGSEFKCDIFDMLQELL
jgi:hypothetical protein